MTDSLLTAGLAGLALGLTLILAIGPQNAFVLRQGLRGEAVFAVALTSSVCDAVLIGVGVLGAGGLIANSPILRAAFGWGGAAFLLYYAWGAGRAAYTGTSAVLDEAAAPKAAGTRRAVATALGLGLINPHAWLDTMVVVGGAAAQVPGDAARLAFGAGALAGSVIFFFGVAYGARRLRPVFAQPQAARLLDAGVAVLMAVIAGTLIVEQVT